MNDQLIQFVEESNRIENIHRPPTPEEIQAHETFLTLKHITVKDLQNFVLTVAGRPLRSETGMDVYIGNHTPIPGGPEVETQLNKILDTLNELTPYETHLQYEYLHPFMDGNGRSGRVLWAWQMQQINAEPFAIPFLHRFYYQTLAHNAEQPNA